MVLVGRFLPETSRGAVMFDTGRILISVRRPNHERALSVTVRSSRTEAVARWLTGCDIRSRDVEARLATLHALCPEAHRAAWKSALTAAHGTAVRTSPLSLQREILWEHLRFLTFDAPRAIGRRPCRIPQPWATSETVWKPRRILPASQRSSVPSLPASSPVCRQNAWTKSPRGRP